MAKVRKDVGELNLTAPEPPQQTYTKSPYVIRDSTRRVELHHFGWGHTRGDTFVYLPNEKVLCTGDAVVNGPFNDPHYANIGNWPNEIRGAQKLDVKYVLPAHGLPAGKELLAAQIQFLEELYKAVAAEVKKGKKLDQLVTLKGGQAVATSVRLSENLMDVWVGNARSYTDRGSYGQGGSQRVDAFRYSPQRNDAESFQRWRALIA